MKKSLNILMVLVGCTLWMSCAKENPIPNSPDTYVGSKKGQKEQQIQGKIEVIQGYTENFCEGVYFHPVNTSFNYWIEVVGELPNEMTLDSLHEKLVVVDLEYNGVSYNCNRAFKVPSQYGNGYPVEIQQAKLHALAHL